MILQIAFAALMAALILLVEHYFPIRPLIGKELPRLAAYVLGMLAILIPLSMLFAWWEDWSALAAIWVVSALGGLAVLGAYGLDSWLAMRQRVKAAERESRILREELQDGSPEA